MESPERYLMVAAGGALGAVARYLASMQFGASPLTTFVVNISGAFLIGLLVGSPAGGDLRSRLLIGTGFLGGYTTFSTLELEALMAWRETGWWSAAANLAGSMVAGFAAVVAGFVLGGRLR
jgi:fluoride exporter